MDYIKLQLESERDRDLACQVNGGVLIRKKVKFEFDPEIYVRTEDASEVLQELQEQGICFHLDPEDKPRIAITAERDIKTRFAVWAKHHCTVWKRTITLRLAVPAWIRKWANNYVENWYRQHAE